MANTELDHVGIWTEVKLQILREYSAAYAVILRNQSAIKHYAYIDGFAGAGTHISKSTGEEIEGSPKIALSHDFSHYHFIDMDGTRTARLEELARERRNVSVYQGDCNDLLLNRVFPTCKYEDYRRALCLLDPYGLNPKWEVVYRAGQMKSVEIFLNFMIMDANMNVLRVNPDKAQKSQIARMNDFWGDETWRDAAYTTGQNLFGATLDKGSNDDVVEAYRSRLKDVAGFKYVPAPLPMKNSQGATVYYLFFASHNETGNRIAQAIFKKYRNQGCVNGN